MNSETFVTSFVDQTSFVMVNENMVKMLEGDCVSAVLLARLIALYTFFKRSGQLENGAFFQKVRDVEERLGINDYHQRKSFQALAQLGLLTTKLVGSPPMRYFTLNFIAIEKALVLETKPEKRVRPMVDKSEFYTTLNANESYEMWDSVRGNIHRPVAEVMYAIKKGLGYSFSGWNPESYGIISRYLEKVYFKPGRPFSYQRVTNWLASTEPKTIKGFVQFDKSAMDDLNRPIPIDKFLKELE